MIFFLSREQVTSVIPLVSTVFPRTLNLKLEGREFGGKSPALGPFFWMKLDPDSLTDREREQARQHPERETLVLAAAGAAKVLGARHSATRAFARAARGHHGQGRSVEGVAGAQRRCGWISARPLRRRRKGEAGLFFRSRLRSHARMDPDLENVIRQALADAQATGWAYLS